MAATKFFNAESADNVKNLNNTSKAAKADVKNVSFMYLVNQCNRFARKNEFCNNTNMRDLLRAVTESTGETQFSARVFLKDYAKRSCLVKPYKGSITAADFAHGDTITDENGNELILATDGESIRTLKPIALTINAVIDAFRTIAMPTARENDKAAREAIREEKKQARAALRAEKKQAQAAYNRGAISFAQYSAIMTKKA